MYSFTRLTYSLTKQYCAIIVFYLLIIKCQPFATNRSQHFAEARSLVSTTATPTTTTQVIPPVEVPDFSEPIANYTVAQGRDAQLSCKINNLGNFRTAWLRVEDKGILTIHNNIITRNYRVGLINDGKDFILTIKNVQPSDKGGYMCQINSVPMKYSLGYLDVLTPPLFDDMPLASTLTSAQTLESATITTTTSPVAAASAITVVEGGNTTLICRANGHPLPVITWRREDNEPILLNGASASDSMAKVEGTSLVLSSVSRLNSGAYLCIASNGVQPSASKRQLLDVQFSPVIRLPQVEVGAHINQQEAKLSCYVELNPLGSYHWVKLNGQHHRQATNDDDSTLIEHDELINSDKFEIVIKQVNSEKVQMVLNVKQLERQDFAWYKCIARNSLGTQSSSIRLYESSSFSLNNMFRGSNQEVPTTGNQQQQQTETSEQQNDQQQDLSAPNRHAKQGGILSRAHTRSSWIQRANGSNRQNEPATPTNALLDSTPNSSMSSHGRNLLLFNHLILFSINFIFLTSVAQIFVVKFHM